MNGQCVVNSTFGGNGKHRWEYFETTQGEEWEKCADCGEANLKRWHDVGSGG